MKTFVKSENEIKKLKVLAVGYKAIKYDGKTQQGDYCYGSKDDKIVGTIHSVHH